MARRSASETDAARSAEQISAACDAARMDFLVMTDHQTEASIRDGQRGMVGEGFEQVEPELPSCPGDQDLHVVVPRRVDAPPALSGRHQSSRSR